MWKEATGTYFRVLPQNFLGGNEENQGKPQLRQPVFGPRFEYEAGELSNRLAPSIFCSYCVFFAIQ
jgi:hypothetical protein